MSLINKLSHFCFIDYVEYHNTTLRDCVTTLVSCMWRWLIKADYSSRSIKSVAWSRNWSKVTFWQIYSIRAKAVFTLNHCVSETFVYPNIVLWPNTHILKQDTLCSGKRDHLINVHFRLTRTPEMEWIWLQLVFFDQINNRTIWSCCVRFIMNHCRWTRRWWNG